MATLSVIPDTNVLLHFRALEEFDWTALTGAADVCFVLVPAVLREIERHKDSGRDPALRDRARRVQSWIRRMLREGAGTGRVDILSLEPGNFPAGLDAATPDDRLIASALELVAGGREVAIFSDDTLLHAKLRGRPLRSLWPGDEDRRPDEPDAQAGEIMKLRRELQLAQSRLPALKLVWNNDEMPLVASIGNPKLDDILYQEALKAKYPKTELPVDGNIWAHQEFIRSRRLTQPVQAYQKHNAVLEEFYNAHREWADEEKRVRTMRSRTILLQPQLMNVGTCPATEIRLVLRLPQGVRHLMHGGEAGVLQNPPGPPGPVQNPHPHRPAHPVQNYGSEKFIPEPYAGGNDGTWPRGTYDRTTVSYLVPKVQQRQTVLLHPFRVLVEDAKTSGLTVDGEAICDELPRPASIKLVVRLRP